MDPGRESIQSGNTSINIQVPVTPSVNGSQSSMRSDITREATEALNLIKQNKDSKNEGLKMLIVMAVPLAASILMSGFALGKARQVSDEVSHSLNTLDLTFSVVPLVSNLQKERGLTSIYLSSEKNELLRKDLTDIFKKVNGDIKSVLLQNDKHGFTILDMYIDGIYYNDANISDHIEQNRISLFEGKMSLEKNLELYTSIVKELINGMSSNVDLPYGDRVWKYYVSINTMLQTTDAVGLQRAIGSAYFASCTISSENKLKMMRLNAESRSYMSIANRYNTLAQRQDRMLGHNNTMTILQKEINDNNFICMNMTAEERLLKSNQWFDATTNYINTLLDYIDSDIVTLKHGLQEINEEANQELLIYSIIIVSVCIGSISLGTCYSYNIYKVIEKVTMYTMNIASEKKDLAKEKMKFDKIVHQILPKQVADDLKNNQPIVPEFFENVTVYFNDIVGFTVISSQCTPHQIVDLLSDLYSLMDSIIEKYDAYKLETIGDAYVVASGIPKRNGIQHAKQIADMSIEINSQVLGYCVPHDHSQKIQLRAGIHSGPATAGVVGRIMPRYCLLGQTVNMANQMESSGEASKIHISETTANMLNIHRGYSMSKAGHLKIKGQVLLSTYWLLGHSHLVSNFRNQE